jgi:N-acetylglucosaminyl-diphospho-decaprenol L-rhamnosyltransferase
VTVLDLAVTLVNWNVCDLLAACLRSVQVAVDEAGLDTEIWVVDNASFDGSVELVSEQFPDVRLVASPINLGFAGGQNLAMRMLGFSNVPVSPVGKTCIPNSGSPIAVSESQGADPPSLPRYVLVLNPDTLVSKSALDEMVRFMDGRPQVGVCGPRLVYGDGSFQHAAYRFPSLVQTFFDFWPINWRLTESRLNGRYPRHLYGGERAFPIDHPLGAAMLLRREVIEQTSGFDLDYQMYVEEIDWCMRIKRAGWEICCVPGAEIVHYEGQSTRQVRPQMVVALWRSRYILFGKYYSRAYQWGVRRIIRAGMRAEIRRAKVALDRGEVDQKTAQALIDAYQRVIDL